VTIINPILDVVLILAAVWMVITVRGLGGIIGRGLNLITIGTVILGIAHLLTTLLHPLAVGWGWDQAAENLLHRVVVLLGFVVLIFGFRQIGTIKK
jgi:hypothetical protein